MSISVNKSQCCVRSCASTGYKTPNLTFHNFPKAAQHFVDVINKFGGSEKIDRRKAWERALLINNKCFSKNKTVCSLHFKPEDYVIPGATSIVKRLKKTAVPSRNLPGADDEGNTLKKRKIIERENRRRAREAKRNEKIELIYELDEKSNIQSITNETSSAELKSTDLQSYKHGTGEKSPASLQASETEVELGIINVAEKVEMNGTAETEEPEEDIGADDEIDATEETVDFVEEHIDIGNDIISKIISSDEELNTVTGIPNFRVLQTIVDVTNTVAPRMALNIAKLSVRNRVILTFIKLKQNLSYALLTVIFKLCSSENCRKTILRMLDVLSTGLKFAVPWPSKAEICKNMPLCFEDFPDTRVIIDCIEILIEKPKNLCCQLAMYSHYKSTYTVKFMTGISPGGIITFVSDAYGGRSSDKAIFEQGCLMKLIEKNDAIMADKGFLIDDICKNNDIKLIRPPFLRKKKQFSAQESLLNSKIAKARVHIERSNQRLKQFKILNSKVPSPLEPRMEQIMTIISATVNLSSSILGDDKFVS